MRKCPSTKRGCVSAAVVTPMVAAVDAPTPSNACHWLLGHAVVSAKTRTCTQWSLDCVRSNSWRSPTILTLFLALHSCLRPSGLTGSRAARPRPRPLPRRPAAARALALTVPPTPLLAGPSALLTGAGPRQTAWDPHSSAGCVLGAALPTLASNRLQCTSQPRCARAGIGPPSRGHHLLL